MVDEVRAYRLRELREASEQSYVLEQQVVLDVNEHVARLWIQGQIRTSLAARSALLPVLIQDVPGARSSRAAAAV